MADRDTEQHQAKSVLGKGREAEIDPVAFGDPSDGEEASIKVPLPPRQAPSDKAHQDTMPTCGVIIGSGPNFGRVNGQWLSCDLAVDLRISRQVVKPRKLADPDRHSPQI